MIKRKSIKDDSWRKRTPIMRSQVELFCDLIDDLCESYASDRASALVDQRAYHRFISGAYALGFVCIDIAHDGRALERAIEEEGWIESRSFRELRQYIHTLLRAERWASEGVEDGIGHIEKTLRFGALRRIAAKLRDEAS
jgi:hypothetical protein